jgi:hypothetical protein
MKILGSFEMLETSSSNSKHLNLETVDSLETSGDLSNNVWMYNLHIDYNGNFKIFNILVLLRNAWSHGCLKRICRKLS